MSIALDTSGTNFTNIQDLENVRNQESYKFAKLFAIWEETYFF